ncbi:1-(5-phosphoribosyl)-5-[(5-phosphoribosylamino)methylideneamino]imidazole-4-carboxamide isomerase [Natribacillus halophilus]|uniref:1-(5-phosphoribosyl)-5-[(5-phosphoribosylamino)methylideneamino] imidazole-4-carboxamide isomerase n=1 Tax=Natribacillus halophilus TaxID=549003 RepID=A0A1G8KLK8_9BACI|nr:1-(5-phosphoribosyl)-5-[(5-phosphoribosylamino)methylideneamino]imidazole-4-carboxamide isomerase [Natribacillus halophilus]SDI44288.1 1-(5-phosphoribosyl)-5-[(5-phosphoribosylamino)methylideneamino] imidazole-4-carboxamide isomerase [Natribacillus halophilus]
MTAFNLFPAIDIRDGKCVRLRQGDYNRETVYGDSPAEMAASFVADGADWIHVVDLDGAREKRPVNDEEIFRISAETGVRIQVGGGIRTEQDVERYLSGGVDRVILGSVAVHNPDFTREMLARYPGRIVIGLDARDGQVAVNGWLESSGVQAETLAAEMKAAGADTFIFTDIEKDGMLQGPNVEAVAALARTSGTKVIASGGVTGLEDVRTLVRYREEGVVGAIVGKALYTGRLDLAEALKEVKGSC